MKISEAVRRFFDISRFASAISYLLIAAVFAAFFHGIWQDTILATHHAVAERSVDKPVPRVTFVQIDEDFLHPDLPMAAQFDDWALLLTRLAAHHPSIILVDYQMSARRFEKIAPGASLRFDAALQSIGQRIKVVMGVSDGGQETRKFPNNVLLACMQLAKDRDGVIREFHANRPDTCPGSATSTLAASGALALGKSVEDIGLPLPSSGTQINHINARSILNQQINLESTKDSIVVIGSNFAGEDEHLASFSTEAFFFHQPMKGALVHALQLKAILTNEIVWIRSPDLFLMALPLTLILGLAAVLFSKRVSVFYLASIGLLMLDWISSVVYLVSYDLYYLAVFPASAALVIQLRQIIQDLLLKRRIQMLLGGLLSPSVMASCLKDPEEFFVTRRIKDATVLVLDIKGYSAESTQLDVKDLYQATNILMGFCTRTVHKYGGNVERFRGDGLLAYFGAPIEKTGNLDDALCCSREIIETVLQSDKEGLARYRNRIRIGLSCGELIIGRVGDQNRFDIGITGQAANRAAHLESMADPIRYPVVIDQASLAKSAQTWPTVDLDERHPKHPKLQLYGLIPFPTNISKPA